MNHSILKKIVDQFAIPADFISAQPYGDGHINDTFLVTCNQAGTPVRYILQKINHHVFKNPEDVMKNIARILEHQHKKNAGHYDASRRALTLINTRENNICYQDDTGYLWRIYLFIEQATTYNLLENPRQAYEAAKTFASFQETLVDLPGPPLIETIPDFHNTPARYETLIQTIEKDPLNRAKESKEMIDFALHHQSSASRLLKLQREGKIPERVTHNDTKLNNIMFDNKTDVALCVLDLDTVMPGLSLYDFGDMIRSFTIHSPEDAKNASNIEIDLTYYEQLLQGYLSTADKFLTKTEKENLAFSGQLISLELGVRFLTDYLQGDTYFKTDHKRHNLDRCKVQFKIVESVMHNIDKMIKIQENL